MNTRRDEHDTYEIERLLRAAAPFEPANPAPEGLVQRSLERRRPRYRPHLWRPAAAAACGLGVALTYWSLWPSGTVVTPGAVTPAPIPMIGRTAPSPAQHAAAPGPVDDGQVGLAAATTAHASIGGSTAAGAAASRQSGASARRAPGAADPRTKAARRPDGLRKGRLERRQARPQYRVAPPPARWRTYLVHEDRATLVAPVLLVDRADDGGLTVRPAVAGIPVSGGGGGGSMMHADYTQEVP